MAHKRLRIIADANMPQVADVFTAIGDVELHTGRSINQQTVRNADVLLVRSVTQVNSALLAGAPVKFVGTATAGVDHIASEIRTNAHIGFSDAKGCNANSVVEYVLACLAQANIQRGFNGLNKAVGIVGAGCVGTALATSLSGLGADVYIYDPFAECNVGTQVGNLGELSHCDVISVHTPLTRTDRYPTVDLVNQAFISSLAVGSTLIAAGRGGVVNEAAVLQAIDKGGLYYYVWHQEPVLNTALMDVASIASPHIAGYSRDGKELATRHLYTRVCKHFGLAEYKPQPPQESQISLMANKNLSGYEQFFDAVKQAWNVAEDDSRLRQAVSADNSGAAFDALRAATQGRLEFSHYEINGLDKKAAQLAALVNFTVVN